jgi:hypothetical protein
MPVGSVTPPAVAAAIAPAAAAKAAIEPTLSGLDLRLTAER